MSGSTLKRVWIAKECFNNVDQQSSKGGSPPPPITTVDVKCAVNHSGGLSKGVWITPWQMSPDPATQHTQPELSHSVVRIALLHDLGPRLSHANWFRASQHPADALPDGMCGEDQDFSTSHLCLRKLGSGSENDHQGKYRLIGCRALGCPHGARDGHLSPQRWDGGILDNFFSSRIFPKRLAASIAQPQ